MLMKLLWLALCTTALEAFEEEPAPNDGSVFVTSYLPDRDKDGQTATAVDLSSLGWKAENAMHSGYITGGPGASSLFGMFTEIGPFGIAPGGTIEPRAVNWTQHYHLLFLDNPVGTGFSFTETEEDFVSRHEQAGEDLQEALSQFFQLFPHPQLRKNRFYVTGESYAGKWVPSCAYAIHGKKNVSFQEERINLKGIAIGDGAMNPAEQFKGFGDLLWFNGMVDEVEKAQLQAYEARIQEALKASDTVGADEIFDEMLNGSHVGNRNYAPENNTVEAHLKPDWMRDVLAELVPIMENYKGSARNFCFGLKRILNRDFKRILKNDLGIQYNISVSDESPCQVHFGGELALAVSANGAAAERTWEGDAISGHEFAQLDHVLCHRNVLRAVEDIWTSRQEHSRAKKIEWRRSSKGPGSQLPDVAGYAHQVGQFSQ
ncbi:unnamed protein product, partial [Prorocentrum cordatum]